MLKPPKVQAEPKNISEAYTEISRQAFASWIMLAQAEPENYSSREKIEKLLNYTQSSAQLIMRELTACRYVGKYRTSAKTRATGYVLLKKPMIAGPRGFVVLNNVLFPQPTLPLAKNINTTLPCKPVSELGKPKFSVYPTSKVATSNATIVDFGVHKPKFKKMPNGILSDSGNRHGDVGDSVLEERKTPTRTKKRQMEFHNKESIQNHNTTPTKRQPPNNDDTQRKSGKSQKTSKKKLACKENLDPSIVLFNNLNLDLFKKKIRDKKEKERKERINKRNLNAKRLDSGNGTRQKVVQPDWSKLEQDLRGNPCITFSPSKKQRTQYISILDRSNRSIEKKELLRKLGSEFGRIYSRYRRQLQKQAGRKPVFAMRDNLAKYAQKAAELCIRKKLTPRQLLMYWHTHIKDFSDSNMLIPPLVFLSSPANVDTVACSDLKQLEPEMKIKKLSPGANSFSDMELYDVRVRQTLQKSGYNVRQYSDMDLMSMQFSARAIAQGVDIFIDDEQRPMAECLAKKLYKGLKLEY